MASKGYRQFTIMQYIEHPVTGNRLIDENTIISAVAHKTIAKYAYVLHDKDFKFNEEDGHPSVTVGTPIPSHFHVAVKCKNAVEISTIARWFGVPENFVQIVRGANAYLDCVEYLTHENPTQQARQKHRYDDAEIKSNHDWRKELNLYQIRRAKRGASKYNQKGYYQNEVLYHGMTLRQVIDEDADAYRLDFQTLEKLRILHIQKFAAMPKNRMNYYVCGRGGVGKGLLSRALARNMYPSLKNDDDIFFELGAENVCFEGYDGQPVIIWNDCRAVDLLTILKGRGNVFNIFDTHPTSQRQNVKYSSIRLTNQVNIVNSVESFTDFLNGLAGEYTDKSGVRRQSEDKGQSYRRFPIIIPLHEEDFDILINKGVLEGSNAYTQYVQHCHIKGNLERINRRLSNYPEEKLALESKTVSPILAAHKDITDSLSGDNNNEDVTDILKEFINYGMQDIDACRRDELQQQAEEEARFIKQQEYEICRILHAGQGQPDRNDPSVQAALLAEKELRENPHQFYLNKNLHLPLLPRGLRGAYTW